MSSDEDRFASLLDQFHQFIAQLMGGSRIQSRSRLIQKNEFGIVDQCPRDRQLLLHSFRPAARFFVAALPATDAPQ